jgi:hypothetical protein
VTKSKNKDFSKTLFWLSSFIVVFLLGGIFHTNAWQPYLFFQQGLNTVHNLIKQQFQTRPDLLLKIIYPGSGVVRHFPDQAQPGLTLVQGIFPEGVELRLIDMSGKVVHRWSVDYFRIWPDPKHIIPKNNIPQSHHNYHTQGMLAFPDGSIVFNVAEKGTVKLSKCGEIQWTIDRMTHHSITSDPDGSLWIPAKGDVTDVSTEYLFDQINEKHLLESRGWYEDRLIKITSDGNIQREISVLQALFEAGLEKELYDVSLIDAMDPSHVNDIDIVTSALARKIKGVEEGDLLISLRQMHMLAILDRNTGKIKWHHVGPWIRQHDPDISAQGVIEVFNNRPVTSSRFHGIGSNIIAFDPYSLDTRIIYPQHKETTFYSDIMGTHQLLSNGNRLITESRAGRVFEIDAKGNIVWILLVPYDETHTTVIESAIRYESEFFTVKDWNC